MQYLPVFMDVRGSPCLVVGGGEVAARKTSLLLEAGAAVTVVAPDLAPNLASLLAVGRITHRARTFLPADLDGVTLAVAATDDEDVNQQVSALAKARQLPVNVVDNRPLCSFIMPAIVDRGPLQIAISTGGAAPVLARLIRGKLEAAIPAAWGRLAALTAEYRDRVKALLPAGNPRRIFWENILGGPIAEIFLSGQEDKARAALDRALAEPQAPITGEVYLVGAGPGDPDLLSFRALRLMQQADVVLHDRLVTKPILDLVRRDAERIYVGKRRDFHAVRQEEINQLLVDLAREGKRVLRLKGGDPFIFGRGGEEIATLAAEGIPFQVVPGVTAASGCAAYAGIPLTHRDHAQSCVFVTGNLKDGSSNLNWPALAHPNQTVVFYMGLKGLDIICRQLMAHGQPADLPAALIQQGTTPHQRVITGTLGSLPAQVEHEQIHAPTLLIVGSVVQLHEQLRWYQPSPEPGLSWNDVSTE
jgi:uroporphyrin-III C-methyltransferase/precorrin-2 dehydrogenase/sirohydrochlorin ferrochelatase